MGNCLTWGSGSTVHGSRFRVRGPVRAPVTRHLSPDARPRSSAAAVSANGHRLVPSGLRPRAVRARVCQHAGASQWPNRDTPMASPPGGDRILFDVPLPRASNVSRPGSRTAIWRTGHDQFRVRYPATSTPSAAAASGEPSPSLSRTWQTRRAPFADGRRSQAYPISRAIHNLHIHGKTVHMVTAGTHKSRLLAGFRPKSLTVAPGYGSVMPADRAGVPANGDFV
jgi:hypothetical protein